jgi:hypothetical protein
MTIRAKLCIGSGVVLFILLLGWLAMEGKKGPIQSIAFSTPIPTATNKDFVSITMSNLSGTGMDYLLLPPQVKLKGI